MPYFAWETAYGIGAFVLLVALIWGTLHYRQHNRHNEAITDKAAKELRNNPDRYEREIKPELEKQIEK